jgi:hypothetical protein
MNQTSGQTQKNVSAFFVGSVFQNEYFCIYASVIQREAVSSPVAEWFHLPAVHRPKKTLKESSLKSRFADGRDQPKNLEFSMNLSVF